MSFRLVSAAAPLSCSYMPHGRHGWRGSAESPQVCCKLSERLLKARWARGGRGAVASPLVVAGARSQGEQVDLAVEVVVAGGADQRGAGAGDGDAAAEAVVGRAADGGELRLLGPGGAGADELVGGAGEVVVQFLADHCGVAGDGQGIQGQALAGLAAGAVSVAWRAQPVAVRVNTYAAPVNPATP